MSFFEMILSGILFKNPKPYLKSVQAYFPSVVQCDNGDFVAAAVVGEAFEAVNLRNILFRSKDNGATWELQGPLYEPEPGKPISEACRIAKSKTGELSAFIMRPDRFREEFGLTNRTHWDLFPSPWPCPFPTTTAIHGASPSLLILP